jgi:glycolate oxidase
VKYGTTRDSVLGLEVVMADGTVARTGGRTRKNVAGYDLTSLFVGSEGTLGIVSQITLRLRPQRRSQGVTVVAFFPTLESAGTAVCTITQRKMPSLLELMDQQTLRAVEAFRPMDLDTMAAAMLLARFDDAQGVDLDEVSAWCTEAGASMVAQSSDPAEGDLLMNARRMAYPALEHMGQTLLDDVAVPIAKIPQLLAAVTDAARRYDVTIGTFGHAGDGNMHPTIVFDPADAALTLRARSAFDAIVQATLSLGGTVTGEHGVGVLKRSYLAQEIGAGSMAVHRAIKAALDPQGIMNPGKVL